MPAASDKQTISALGSGKAQVTTFLDYLFSLATSVGCTYLSIMRGDYTDAPTLYDSRERVMRVAPIDPHHSRVDIVMAGNGNGSKMTVWPIYDADIHKQGVSSAPYGMGGGFLVQNIGIWPGNWSGTYPNLGNPAIQFGGSINHSKTQLDFGTGADSWVCRFMGSEYGLFWTADNGGYEAQNCIARPTGTQRPGRNIEFRAAPTAAGPYTFTTPTGAPGIHLEFESDGKTIPITFPTGTPLTAWQIAREITMQAGGFIAGTRRRVLPNVEMIAARIPTLRFPTAGISATGITPRICLTYQDPTFVAAGWDFGRSIGISMDAGGVTAGLRGQLTRAVSTWPANQIRIGSVVYNRNLDETAIVKAFTTTTNPLDTLIVDNAGPGAWSDAHVYDVYPMCDHAHGVGVTGGLVQITKWDAADSTVAFDNIVKAPDTKVVCSDLYGEAYGHFALNQGVMLCNNGCAVILDVDDVSGFILGEFVQNTDTGAYGVIRAIDTVGDRLLVDTIQGRTLIPRLNFDASYRYWAWNEYSNLTTLTYDTIVSYAHPDSPAPVGTGNTTIGAPGTPGIESSTVGNSTEGWSGLFQIIGISRAKNEVGGAPDDYRTVLTLATNASAVNGSLDVFPSGVLGIRSRIRINVDANYRYHYVGPQCGGGTLGAITEMDLRANERANGAPQPTHTPDGDTSSFDVGSHILRLSNSRYGTGMLGAYAHFRGINISNPSAVSNGDLLPEQRDILRMWIAVGVTSDPGAYGALTTNPAVAQRTCIGPSDSSLG